MTRPRFLADNDLKEAIILDTARREAAIEFPCLRDLGLETLSDNDVLAYAAAEHFIVVSHDVNTMTAEAFSRLGAGQPLYRLLLVH